VYSYVQRGLNAHIGFLAGWMIMADYLLAPASSTVLLARG
jgi:amino acid transporter